MSKAEAEKLAALKNAVLWVKKDLNTESLFALAVVSRTVMAQGDGLSWHQVKNVIDGVLSPSKVTVTYNDGEVGLSEQYDD